MSVYLMFLQHRDLKASQIDGMLELCRNQNKAELDLHLKYHPQSFDLLDQLVTSSQDIQLKKLDEVIICLSLM